MSYLSPSVTAIRSILQIRLTLLSPSHVGLKSSARFQNRLTLSKNHALIMGSYSRPVSFLSHNQFKTSQKMVTTSVCRKSPCPCCATYCTAADKKSTDNANDNSDSRSTLDSKDSEKSVKYNLTDTLLSGYEKRKLVLTGFYKTMNDVPDRVSDAKMKRAGDLFRIYTNISTAVIVLITLLITINRAQKYRKRRDEEIEKQSR